MDLSKEEFEEILDQKLKPFATKEDLEEGLKDIVTKREFVDGLNTGLNGLKGELSVIIDESQSELARMVGEGFLSLERRLDVLEKAKTC